ncbi:D-isomer specific 2-hydroxyacid dehydrogenase family protein [Aspergillus lucknowensis]|uniref:D-isomer specific 2-hydroxyacid dehydrogenase NAD-binding domain-containing protein n=1 Tax=Aspergillus lucknowensis TaxID=176173 RepID=A0ABR4M009_9EURO
MGDASLPKPNILLAFHLEFPASFYDEIRRRFPDAEITSLVLEPGAPLPSESARKASIIVTLGHLPCLPNLEDTGHIKFIHFFSAGLDKVIDHPILTDTEIPVTTSSGIHGPPIAEWTLLNWLAASRKFSVTYEDQKKHIWSRDLEYTKGIQDHVGKKIGILGYGSIGRQIARVAVALGATVYAFTASPKPTPSSRRDPHYIVPGTGDPDGTLPISWHHGIDKASLHAFLSLGLDHVVVCLPLTPQTTHLLGAEEFAVLAANKQPNHRNPYLTNISRGRVLDQDALIASLKSGELSGAALDVTDPEPLPEDHPLWDAPNVQISPHVSALGEEYFFRSFDIVRVNLDRSRRGEPLVNSYKRGRGY